MAKPKIQTRVAKPTYEAFCEYAERKDMGESDAARSLIRESLDGRRGGHHAVLLFAFATAHLGLIGVAAGLGATISGPTSPLGYLAGATVMCLLLTIVNLLAAKRGGSE